MVTTFASLAASITTTARMIHLKMFRTLNSLFSPLIIVGVGVDLCPFAILNEFGGLLEGKELTMDANEMTVDVT